MAPGSATLRFSVAGLAVQVSGPGPLVEAVRVFYASFPLSHAQSHQSIAWSPDGLNAETPFGPLHIGDPSLAPPLTSLLVARLVARSLPSVVHLHGNALAGPGGNLLLLVGASGAGKSTLSRELQARGWKPVSEDLLLVDASRRLLLPFPRAATIRSEETAGIPWLGLGRGDSRKVLESPVAAPASEFPLEAAAVVLLGNDDPAPSPGATRYAWVCRFDPGLAEEFRAVGLPVTAVESIGRIGEICYACALSDGEAAVEAEILEKRGLLVLSRGDSRPASEGRHFSDCPAMRAIPSSEALLRLVRHRILYESVAEAPARPMMQLARAFAGSTFHHLLPGGTPAATAECLDSLG